MNQYLTIKKIRIAAIVICAMIALILGIIAMNRYQSSIAVLNDFDEQKEHLKNLKKEIEQTQLSLEKLKKEQEEFKKTLFDERDVPAFLDGISNSAAKSSVHVMEMKTQQFSAVIVPKEMIDINQQVSKVKFVDDNKQNSAKPEIYLSERLTLASMPIRIKINGTFEAIVSFLSSIENYRQLLTVSNVEISITQNYPQLTCEFNLRIYSLKTLKDIKL